MLLLATRMIYAQTTMYIFYTWNLVLAVIPVCLGRALVKQKAINGKSIALIAGWLLFFPNAPYVITDILHFYQRPGVPLWFDLFLVLSAAWSGLAAGFISLMQVDAFIRIHTSKKFHEIFTPVLLFAASTGIYLGRFPRFNSWDVLSHPRRLAGFAVRYTFQPVAHLQGWVFSILCTIFLTLMYYTIKNLPVPANQVQADKV
jgi:uncharacterized membrane protein